MTQDFKDRDFVNPQTLLPLCATLIGAETNQIPHILEKYQQEDPIISLFSIKKHSRAIDIPHDCFQWIIAIKGTFIECTFSNPKPHKNRCISICIKQDSRDDFREICKWIAQKSTCIQKESHIRRQLIDKYYLAAYEIWQYKDLRLKTVERPDFKRGWEEKYSIYIRPTIKSETLFQLVKTMLHLSTQEVKLLLEEYQNQYPDFWIQKIEEYPSEENRCQDKETTWKIYLADEISLTSSFWKTDQSQEKLICNTIYIEIENQLRYDEIYEYIKKNGISEPQDKSTLQKIVEEYNFPRYQTWLYDKNLILETTEQPSDPIYKYYITVG